jgi:hypothetical protein
MSVKGLLASSTRIILNVDSRLGQITNPYIKTLPVTL